MNVQRSGWLSGWVVEWVQAEKEKGYVSKGEGEKEVRKTAIQEGRKEEEEKNDEKPLRRNVSRYRI